MRRVAPYLGYLFVSLVGATSRIRWVGRDHLEELERRGLGFIYAFWHSRQVFFTYTHRGAGVHVLVSRSRDGEIIARVMELSDIVAVRGSSSKGAAAGARELMDLARERKIIGLTPDGPRGPARKSKAGVVFLAQKTGLPILPIANALSRKLVFRKSWDSFQVPLPFSRAFLVCGKPVFVSPEDDLRAKLRELDAELNRVTDEADRLAEGR